jgi:hypothetical protein
MLMHSGAIFLANLAAGVRDTSQAFMEYGTTVLHPVALVFLICMVALALFSGRSRAILAVLLVCVFMPHAQRLVIGGLDFSVLRLILLAAWGRVLVRGEYRGFKPTKLDRILVLWVASAAVIHVLRVGGGGVVWAVGSSLDALTAFFLLRVLVRRREDVFVVTRQLAWIAVVLGVFIVFELVTQYNVFSALSGLSPTPQIRSGRVRCKAAFSHPILAGSFGAVLVPILVAVFRRWHKERALFASGIVAATAIVVAAGSSGPLVAWAVGVIGCALWSQRSHMRAALGTMAGMALVIHLIREKPVWSLIGKLSNVTGGTGYHRYRLIDAFITRFRDWAILGTDNTAYWGWGLQDTTNQYVAEGVKGGLLTFVLFIFLLHLGFSALRRTRLLFEHVEGPKSLWAMLAWGFSGSLAVHCVSFIGVSYFGQMKVFFVMFLGLIPALSKARRRVRSVSTRSRRSGAESREVPARSHPTSARATKTRLHRLYG